ncbi:hypothetical protein [Microcystis phage Mwe-JY05]
MALQWQPDVDLRGPKGDPGTPADESAVQALQARARTAGFGPVRASAAPRRFGLDANYSASPNVCVLGDGRLAMIWREGGGHASRDGKIMWSFSSDEGRSWTTPTVWMPYPGNGIDPRGTAITLGKDRRTVYVPYFYGSDANAAMGVYLKISPDNGATWGPQIRVDPNAAYAATDGMGVIEVGGTLFLPWYGKQSSSESYESIWLARSTNGGQTWTSTRMVSGPATSRNYHEPNLIDCDGTLVMLFRWGTAESIGMIRSTNGGASWTTATPVITPGTGKAALVWTSTKVLTCIYRDLAGVAVYRSSYDYGSTWTGEQVLAYQTGSGWTVYAGACEISPGMMFVAQGVEQNNGNDCRLWTYYLTDGAATTPTGALNPDRVARVLQRVDQVIALDDFDRPNTTTGLGDCVTGQPWQASGQALRIRDSRARGTSTNGVAGFAWVEAKNPNVLVEADFNWSVNSNIGLILRWKDASNYFFYVSETTGSAVRFYVRNAGTYYKLAEATTVPTLAGQWHRYRASLRGTRFLGFIDDQLVLAYNISSTDTTLLGGETKHGFQLAESTGTGHHCRRFVVMS